jgi:hypothetical protein
VIRLGLALPHYPFSFPQNLPAAEPVAVAALRYAIRAEDLRLNQIWVSDHFWINVSPAATAERRQATA